MSKISWYFEKLKQLIVILLYVIATCESNKTQKTIVEKMYEPLAKGGLINENVSEFKYFKHCIIERGRNKTGAGIELQRFENIQQNGKRKEKTHRKTQLNGTILKDNQKDFGCLMKEYIDVRIEADKERVEAYLDQFKDLEIPDGFDWRNMPNVLSPIGNQGNCGASWAFSFTATIETNYALHRNKSVEPLSKSQLVDCIPTNTTGNSCLDGGNWDTASDYVNQNGIETEAEYPYENIDGKVRKCVFDPSKVNAKALRHSTDAFNACESMKRFVFLRGPVHVNMNPALIDSYYKDGTIIRKNEVTCASTPIPQLFHTAVIVGFGIQDYVPYWVVRNSRGEQGPDKGYFKIERGSNTCGIETFAQSPVFDV